MFETQVGLLRAQLLQLHHHHHNNDDNDDDEEVREHVTELQVRLSERDAALKVLREELRQRNKARATATAGAAAVTPPPTMTALEALDVGVMVREICIYCTCWLYSLCNFQYRQHYEHSCSYNFDC